MQENEPWPQRAALFNAGCGRLVKALTGRERMSTTCQTR
jgi:hypothetical protein